MDIKKFWEIIDATVAKDALNTNQQISEIENELSKYSIADIREFNNLSEQLIEKSKNEKIFHVICSAFEDQIEFEGGTSWSRYEFFIGWLLMQGSEIFNLGLSAPYSLKDLILNIYNSDLSICTCEEAIFIASNAYEIKTGRNYFEDF